MDMGKISTQMLKAVGQTLLGGKSRKKLEKEFWAKSNSSRTSPDIRLSFGIAARIVRIGSIGVTALVAVTNPQVNEFIQSIENTAPLVKTFVYFAQPAACITGALITYGQAHETNELLGIINSVKPKRKKSTKTGNPRPGG